MMRSSRLGLAVLLSAAACVSVPDAHAAERPLRVGVDVSWPPHQFVDAKGQPTGFDVELFEAVAKAAGLSYELITGDWPELRAALEAGRLDVVPGAFETEARESVMEFSTPTAWVRHTLFVPEASDVDEVAALPPGARVLVAAGGPQDDEAAQAPPSVVVERRPTSEEALRALARGEGEAAIALDTLGLHLVRVEKLPLRTIGKPLRERTVRFAVPEGRAELLAALNDGLAQVRADGTYDHLWDRWFGVLKPEGLSLRRVLPWMGALLALLVAALAWTVLLRREVAWRTLRLVAAEKQQLALERRLLQGEKMEALGRMAAGVAHDLKNVMLVIGGNLALARESGDVPRPVRDSLDEIESASQSAAALVKQLVAFGSGEGGRLTSVSWRQVIDTCEPLLRRVVSRQLALVFEPAADATPMRGDASQLQQVLMNLVLNAADALGENGTIRVTTRTVADEGRRWSELSVRDDGPGMDAATCERVFEPYYSTKGGTRGLGLATVAAVAQRHAGSVTVASEPGAGTCFTVRIPAGEE